MDPAAAVAIPALVAAGLSPFWVEGWRRYDELQELRRNCHHSWGPPKKVPVGYKVWCEKCNEQEFAHKDGTLCPFPCETCGRGVQ